MRNNHWLVSKVLPLIVIAVLALGWIGYWIMTPSIKDAHIPFYIETVRDNLTGAEDGELLMNGTWRLQSEGITGSSAAISCRKEAMECSMASADLLLGGWFHNSITHFKVSEWSPEGRITGVVTGECSTLSLTIESSAGHVALTGTPVDGSSEEVCGTREERVGTWELTDEPSSPFATWKGDMQYDLYTFLRDLKNK